jgi:hypothetical protein
MSTKALLRNIKGGVACNKCRAWVDGPEGSYDFHEEELVINLWSCVSCGNRFETERFTGEALSPKAYDDAKEENIPIPLVA